MSYKYTCAECGKEFFLKNKLTKKTVLCRKCLKKKNPNKDESVADKINKAYRKGYARGYADGFIDGRYPSPRNKDED